MKTPFPPSLETLRQRVRDAVSAGQQARARVQQEVCAVLQDAEMDAEGWQRLAGEVLAGARDGFARVAPAEQPALLRQVVDGLADALEANANALRLALEEARGRGHRFTQEELRQAGEHLEAAGRIMKETLQSTTHAARAGLAEQARELAAHAQRAWERSQPAVAAAVAAARAEPTTLGRQAAQAGAAVATETAGALFIAVGRRLQKLGEQWRGPHHP